MHILLAHGSSEVIHKQQVQALATRVSTLLGEEVGIALLSDNRLPEGSSVLPLFLGEGKHVTEDIPKMAAQSNCIVLPPLSMHANAIANTTIETLTSETRRIQAMFVLYHFSGFEKLAAALYASVKICSKHALASLHSEPSAHSILQLWQQAGVKNISLQPMLLFEGKSMDRLRRMTEPFEITMAPVLSEYDGIATIIADCLKGQE